jgi:hypothetical protein
MERVGERERGRDGEREGWGQREEDKRWVVVVDGPTERERDIGRRETDRVT